MGLDKIRQAVLDTVHTEAARIVHAAEKQAAEHLDRDKAQADDDAERLYQARARAVEEDFARKLSQFKGAAGKQVLEKRNACLRTLFERARRQILEDEASAYAEVMGRLLARAAGEGGGTVRIHPDERGLFEALIAELNRTRRAEAQLAPDAAHPLPVRGGFVLVTGQFEIDQTLDTILTDIEHELLPKIAAELFTA